MHSLAYSQSTQHPILQILAQPIFLPLYLLDQEWERQPSRRNRVPRACKMSETHPLPLIVILQKHQFYIHNIYVEDLKWIQAASVIDTSVAYFLLATNQLPNHDMETLLVMNARSYPMFVPLTLITYFNLFQSICVLSGGLLSFFHSAYPTSCLSVWQLPD